MSEDPFKIFIDSLDDTQRGQLGDFLFGQGQSVQPIFDLEAFSSYTGAIGISVSEVTVETIMEYMDWSINKVQAESYLSTFQEAMNSEGGVLGKILRKILI